MLCRIASLWRTLKPPKERIRTFGGFAALQLPRREFFPTLNFLLLVLQLIELPVDTAFRQQLLMCADFPQLRFVHDDNTMGVLDGGEPVRNNQGGSVRHQTRKRFSYPEFGFGIYAGGCFVQDQYSRIVRQCPSKADELFLAS